MELIKEVEEYTNNQKTKQEIIYIVSQGSLNFETLTLSKKIHEKGILTIRIDGYLLEKRREEIFDLTLSKLEIIDFIGSFLNYSDEFKTFLNPIHKFGIESIRYYFETLGMNYDTFKLDYILRKILNRASVYFNKKDPVDNVEFGKYLTIIEKDQLEVKKLYDSMEIHTSIFFKNKKRNEYLKNKILPEIKNDNKDFKMLIVGPGNGEETMSIALMLYDFFKESEINYKIYCIDSNQNLIKDYYKNVKYPLTLKDKIPVKYHKYLIAEDSFFLLRGEIIYPIIFINEDFLSVKAYRNFDFVLCENVLGPLKQAVRKKILINLMIALKLGGFFFVEEKYIKSILNEESEPILNKVDEDLFELLNKKNHLILEKEYDNIKEDFINVQETHDNIYKKSREEIKEFQNVYNSYVDKKPEIIKSLKIENKKLREEIEEMKSKYKLTRSVLNSAVDDFKSNLDKQEASRKELERAYNEISSMKEKLELTVRERTSQLKLSNMELEKSNNALLKSNKALEKIQSERSFFFANLSHELRTPLNAILGFSKILQEIMNFEDWEYRERSYVDAINISGKSLLRLVNSVHDFTKIELNELKVYKAKCKLRDIINPIYLHFKNEAKRKGLDYILEISEDIPKWIISDELLIKQVLDNLLSNAIKFTKEGEIKLKVQCKGKNDKKNTMDLLIEVSDTGFGMPQDKVNKIFDSFSQIHNKGSINERGSGLGLYISSKIVHELGGLLSVSSELNKGSLFSVWLKEISFSKGKLEPGALFYRFFGSKVLIADDVNLNLQLYEAYLSTHNLKIQKAGNGEELIEKTYSFRPDLIITDYDMPDITGDEVLKKIREKGVECPAILISALEIEDSIKKEFNSFLRKPIEREDLISEIAKFIDHSMEFFKVDEDDEKNGVSTLTLPKKINKKDSDLLIKLNKKFIEWKNSMELTAIEKEVKLFREELNGTSLNVLNPLLEELEESASNFKINTVLKLLKKGIELTSKK